MAQARQSRGYKNNPNLKQVGEEISFTRDQIAEQIRCEKDPIYFLETYGKIVALGKGVVPFKLFPYQKRFIHSIVNNRKIVGKIGRQQGKSTIVAGYYAWFCLFNNNTTSAILANKLAVAKEIFSRVQFIIENCPKWLQQGISEWNKTSLELENGARVFCSATSPSAVRGFSVDNIFLDEFAHLSPNLAEEFIASVFPTLSSSPTSKLIIVSTPKGMNHFYSLWDEAERGVNGFATVSAEWHENPNRDEKWLADQLKELKQLKFNQEVLCDFLQSGSTLVSVPKLRAQSILTPEMVLRDGSLRKFVDPIKDHSYVMTVDTARGKELDYSAFVVIDISVKPYQVVCTYKNNSIQTLVYPEVVMRIAQLYNDAFVLIEVNDLGQQVADILFYDLEYENVYMSRGSDSLKEGAGGGASPGFRTTKKTKAIGCNMLKDLIENDQLTVSDEQIISELTVFVRVGNTYKAEEGKHDDLAMCLIFFGYLVSMPVFQNLFDFSLREQFFADQLHEVEEQMLPLGFFDNGLTEYTNEKPSAGGWVDNGDTGWNF